MTKFKDYTVEDTKVAVARILKDLPPHDSFRSGVDENRKD